MRIHERGKSKGAAQVLDTYLNWDFFTKTENFSSLALIHPSIFIFPETLKHLSSALGLPPFAPGSGPATWEAGKLRGTDRVHCANMRGVEGFLRGAAPGSWSDFTFLFF